MKKFLALTLTLCLCLALGVTALAADLPEGWTPADGARTGEDGPLLIAPAPDSDDAPTPETVDVPLPKTFNGTIIVDGEELDTTGIPGAPNGYVPMRLIAEASGGMASYYPDENSAFFFLSETRFNVNFADLSVEVEFEPVEDVQAYLDPSGYTFLPISLLNGRGDIVIDDNPELSSIRYDITTIPERTEMETLAYSIMEAANSGRLTALDAQIMEDNYGFHMDAYDELVAYQPMMTGQPTTIVIAQVKEGQMDTAKADFQDYLETVKGTLGYYPSTAEALEKAQIAESPNGQCLILVSTWESNDVALEMFNAAYPAAE